MVLPVPIFIIIHAVIFIDSLEIGFSSHSLMTLLETALRIEEADVPVDTGVNWAKAANTTVRGHQ